MSAQRRRDTSPELALRRALHKLGFRYLVDMPPIKGLRRKADLVFTRRRVAVFVDGCFWHRCPEHGTAPKVNVEWWREKLARTVERDRETDTLLRVSGWTVVRVWEHEDPTQAARRVAEALAIRSAAAIGDSRPARSPS